MPNTALNRTTQALLTNKSGGNLTYGAVVVLDNTNTNGFTTTTTAGLSTRGLGVILEPNGIANNATGMVAIGGWCPQVNLNTAATIGQFIKTHTVAGQGAPHSSPQVEGDFAVALAASATPAAILLGGPNPPGAGGTSPGGSNTQVQYNNAGAFGGITGATTNGTALTLVAPVLGTPASGTLTNCTGFPAGALATVSSIYVNLQDQKAQNTAGGTFTSGAWRTRTLNTEVSDVGGLCSLASDQFTLSAGTYIIHATAPAWNVVRNQIRLQNVTDTATILTGTTVYAYTAGAAGAMTVSSVRGIFTIGASKALEIQHQCETTAATNGFGVAGNFTTEVYTVVELWKVG